MKYLAEEVSSNLIVPTLNALAKSLPETSGGWVSRSSCLAGMCAEAINIISEELFSMRRLIFLEGISL